MKIKKILKHLLENMKTLNQRVGLFSKMLNSQSNNSKKAFYFFMLNSSKKVLVTLKLNKGWKKKSIFNSKYEFQSKE